MKKLVIGLVLALAACGGGGNGPTTPSTPTPTPPVTVEFVNGLDHAQAVSGLAVTVDGVTVGKTGADGRTPSPVTNGAHIQTSGRSDYIDRDTRFLSSSPRLPLWHLQSQWNLAYFQKLVYDYAGGNPADTTWDYLWCPAPGVRTVFVSDDIRNDPEAFHRVNVAISEANRVEHGYLTLRWADSGRQGDYEFKIDPNDPSMVKAMGVFRARLNSAGYMTGGTIVMSALWAARIPHTPVHELGHGLGLMHSRYQADVMYIGAGRDLSIDSFNEGDEMAVVNISQRKPRNRFPDTDPSVAGSAYAGPPPPIVCGHSRPGSEDAS